MDTGGAISSAISHSDRHIVSVIELAIHSKCEMR